jgi:hypothetical protein
MGSPSKEAKVLLALAAIQSRKKLSVLAAAKLYDVPETTLRRRRAGRPARRDTTPNSRKLTQSEEEAIVQYVLELCARAFPPRLRGVEDMANQLLRVRDAPPVGKLWAHNFVRRKEELRTRWTRRYDYQRAKCEDPKVIGEWLIHVSDRLYIFVNHARVMLEYLSRERLWVVSNAKHNHEVREVHCARPSEVQHLRPPVSRRHCASVRFLSES